MVVPCPTCKRLGRVPKAFPPGTAMGYCGPNGERVPYESCRTCSGSGWIDDGKIGFNADPPADMGQGIGS